MMPPGVVCQGQPTCDLGAVGHSDPADVVVGDCRNFPGASGPMAAENSKDKSDTGSNDLEKIP